jgi:hypothetical protein
MAVSEQPPDDGKPSSRPAPDLPDTNVRLAELHAWESDEYDYVLYGDGHGEHLYSTTAVDLEVVR